MHRFLPTLLLVFTTTLLSAQITLTTDYFPVAGDTLRTAETDSIYANGIDLQAAGGANLFWSFGTPMATLTSNEAVEANTDTLFPEADIVIRTDVFDLSYYQITDTAMLLVGVRTRQDIFPDFELVAPVQPGRATRRAGISFGDTLNSVTVNSTVISPDSLPAEAIAMIGDALNAVDSIRITATSTRSDRVDAWGTVRLEDNYYEVLRERRDESIYVDLEVKAGGLPIWVNVTNAVLAETPQAVGFLGQQDTTLTYYFWNDESIEPIGTFAVDPATGVVRSMSYKRAQTSTSVGGPAAAQARIKVYPNPATNLATFEMEGLQRGTYSLSLTSLLGQHVASREFTPLGDQTSVTIDVTNLPAGLYLYTLRNGLGRTITTKKLLVR